jgi:hypothetical protein
VVLTGRASFRGVVRSAVSVLQHPLRFWAGRGPAGPQGSQGTRIASTLLPGRAQRPEVAAAGRASARAERGAQPQLAHPRRAAAAAAAANGAQGRRRHAQATMTRKFRRAEISRLAARLAEMRSTVVDLELRREELMRRAAAVALLERVAAEADAHLAQFGAPPMLRGADVAAEGGELGPLAPTALEERIAFLRPGRSLLPLEGCTGVGRARVCARCMHVCTRACLRQVCASA